MRFVNILLALLLVVVLSACITPKPAPDGQILLPGSIDRAETIGVIWLSHCSILRGCKDSDAAATLGEFNAHGAKGIGMAAVLAFHRPVMAVLDTVDATDIVYPHYLQKMAGELQYHGYTVKIREKALYPGYLEKLSPTNGVTIEKTQEVPDNRRRSKRDVFGLVHNFDFTAIREELGADFLFVLEVQQFGVVQEFAQFNVPKTIPYGMSAVRMYLLDKESTVLLDTYAAHEVVTEGPWLQPGDWENLLGATNKSLETVVTRAVGDILGAIY